MSTIALAPAGASAAAPAVTPRLRLTRRGRVVLATLAALPVLIGLALGGLNGQAANASADEGAAFEYVTVFAGESLWEIAASIAPHADPRDVISDIVRLNALDSWQVQAGERIAIPHAWAPRG